MTPEQLDTAAEMARSEKVENYIRSLKWSDTATEWEKTLVAGNIRAFASWLHEQETRPMDNAEQAAIDAAWESHKAAAPGRLGA